MAALPNLSLENIETRVYTSNVRHEMEEKISELESKNQELQNALTKQQAQIMDNKAALENKSYEDILEKYRKFWKKWRTKKRSIKKEEKMLSAT